MLENRSSYECFSLLYPAHQYEYFSFLYPAHQHDLNLYLSRNETNGVGNPEFVEEFCIEFLNPFVQEQYIRSEYGNQT